MRIQTKKLTGMVMCILGVLATSSCSKDDFFGLNEFETLDYSKKTEIALSQEYTDYAIACYKLADMMSQLSDTTVKHKEGEINGRPISYMESGESIMDLLEKLKAAYPELAYVDKPDYEEIQRIALSKNEILKNKVAPQETTKFAGNYFDSQYFIGELNCGYTGYWTDYPLTSSFSIGHWYLLSHLTVGSALDQVLFDSEFNFSLGNGGLIFGDDSAVSITGKGEWPSIINYASPSPEADFIVVNNTNLSYFELLSIGQNISGGNRFHYFVDRSGEVWTF